MPSLGADMEAGTLIEWLKHPGDAINRGDIIAVVDTQKGAIEIEVFEDGVLETAVVQPGAKVPVGTVLAVIRGKGEPAAPPPAARLPEALGRARVSPTARALAAELSVDLTGVRGTGPQGAITREDVERAASRTAPAAVSPAQARTAAMRTAIAAAMARSKRDVPHYYLSTTIDMQSAVGWLRAENEKRPMPDRLLAIALLVRATALALRDVPELNGHWIDGAFRKPSGIHVGCAISLRGGGLVAPALHDTDRKDLTAIMREIRDLVVRARAGSLKSSELADPTITVTNLGELGVDAAFGIIYPPQVALVGFGRIVERPWIVAGRVEPRSVLVATLSADHRVTDGHRGGQFLSAVDRLLQTPETL
jgi:pyruvate dehydrogenase E2 component (dihydrolipoamide acetyltransferase)